MKSSEILKKASELAEYEDCSAFALMQRAANTLLHVKGPENAYNLQMLCDEENYSGMAHRATALAMAAAIAKSEGN